MNINRDDAFEIILERHPKFAPIWKEHLDFWNGDIPGITNDFSEYVHYVIDLIKNNNVSELDIALNLIEHLLEKGNDDVIYGVQLGFLEGITNSLLSMESKYSLLFSSKLKSKSKEFCRNLDTFWGTTTPGVN